MLPQKAMAWVMALTEEGEVYSKVQLKEWAKEYAPTNKGQNYAIASLIRLGRLKEVEGGYLKLKDEEVI
ncbi:hypothetical protein KAR91_39615 [Candidatus Pacearchaeota archaeon]|nr:hypothetical protein [Candidatus Pacearchaeota archaeon]